MRIIVLGQKGQLARSLVEAGSSRGLSVFSVGRPELDLSNRNSIEKAISQFDPDILINAAAYTLVDQAERELEIAFAINPEKCKRCGVCFMDFGCPAIGVVRDEDGEDRYEINQGLCTRCGACVQVCPTHAIGESA